jgi:hypothetical protein
MRILVWHVHGAWMTAFVQGEHTYLVPTTPDRGPYGLGRARTYRWPESAVEISPAELASADVDAVVLQRPEEWQLAEAWLGRRLGRDLPAIYVEHNTPQGSVPHTRHPLADRDDVTLVHVTPFNSLFWDTGGTRTTVIDHGIPDPGLRYRGGLPRLATAINEPVRRGRVTGTDLLPRFADVAPIDIYGMGLDGLAEHLDAGAICAHGDLPHADLHTALAQRRVYLHPMRWTSLGLALLEAMAMGMPVVAVAAAEAAVAVPPGAGAVSTNVDELVEAARWLVGDPDEARRRGAEARRAVLDRFGLPRFLACWDRVLKEGT